MLYNCTVKCLEAATLSKCRKAAFETIVCSPRTVLCDGLLRSSHSTVRILCYTYKYIYIYIYIYISFDYEIKC